MTSPASLLNRSSSMGNGSGSPRSSGNTKDTSAVITSPSRKTLEASLPPRHYPSQGGNVATPHFELKDDPLSQSGQSTPPPKSGNQSQQPILPKIDVNLAQKGKRRSGHEGNKRPTSPHITVATPTSARHSQLNSTPDRRASMPGSSHAPTPSSSSFSNSQHHHSSTARSPVRQSSLGKAAAHAAQTLIDVVSGRNTPQSAAFTASRPDSASAINRRHVASPDGITEHQFASLPTDFDENEDDEQDKGHGTRRQSSGRWTPTILGGIIRKAGSPGHSSHRTSTKSANSPRFQIYHTEPEELSGAEWEQQQTDNGRQTPAKYRPAEETAGSRLGLSLQQQPGDYYPMVMQSPSQPFRGAHPLSHAHKVSTSTIASNSSHSIQMHSSPHLSSHSRHTSLQASPRMNSHSRQTSVHVLPGGFQASQMSGPGSANTVHSSPLVVPQARRGAINLRPGYRNKKAAALAKRKRAAAVAAASHKKPLRLQMLELLSVVIRALRYPTETAGLCQRQLRASIKGLDDSFRDPRTGARVWRPSWLGAYIPLLIWLVVSLSSTITVLIWHTQVFRALDRLSTHLQSLGFVGRLSLGTLIFLTTFPPLPLYSTLIILCGFSFGLIQGFIISYIAALLGAVVVFLLSRSLLKGWMVELLNKSGGLKRVVRAIEKRPKLLFLVRLAPYPYNLMNTLLASSPTLTLQTYTLCTALALPKLLVHCALGTSIKNFAAYNGAGGAQQAPVGGDSVNQSNGTKEAQPMLGSDLAEDATASQTAETIKHVFGFVGIGLCVGIFLYLFSVARKAVDEELDEDEYDLVLSEEEGEGEEEQGEGDGYEDGSDLDDDDLNLGRGSGESVKEEASRASLAANGSNARVVSMDRMNGARSEPSLVDGPNRSDTLTLSHVNQKLGLSTDGTTPNYVTAPSRRYGDGSNPYFAQTSSNANGRNNRHLESQVSLADSIVEMEKHAVEMEEEQPLFHHQQQHHHAHFHPFPFADRDAYKR